MKKQYIYGPVPSRRFGRSLGVDIIPFKICTYDCIYCQLGKTTYKTIKRRKFYKPPLVLDELREFLTKKVEIDYITVSGSGEPTLNINIGEIISKIKSMSDIPIIVLTNGSLLWDKEVRQELVDADIVVPSMDGVSTKIFERINRPNLGLTVSEVLKGLGEFSEKFKGKIYLEIMMVKGVNDTDSEVNEMKEFVQDLRIDKIQLNTVVRPPSEEYAFSLNNEEMEYIREKLFCTVPVEIIGSFSPKSKVFFDGDIENEIINLLKRRPCTLQDMSDVLGMHHNELIKYITELLKKNIIRSYSFDDSRGNYYMCY